jgi:hypothetical protein
MPDAECNRDRWIKTECRRSRSCFDARGSYSLRIFREDCVTIPRLNRETKKYLGRKAPSRPRSRPPQLRQVISRSVVGPGGASARTTSYSARSWGHLKFAGNVSRINERSRSECIKEPPKERVGLELRSLLAEQNVALIFAQRQRRCWFPHVRVTSAYFCKRNELKSPTSAKY